MAKERTDTHTATGIERTTLWYRNPHGRRAYAVKYHDPFDGTALAKNQEQSAEEAPIYVALQGRQPELLVEALEELELYRANAVRKMSDAAALLTQMTQLYESTQKKVGLLRTKKRWWQRRRVSAE